MIQIGSKVIHLTFLRLLITDLLVLNIGLPHKDGHVFVNLFIELLDLQPLVPFIVHLNPLPLIDCIVVDDGLPNCILQTPQDLKVLLDLSPVDVRIIDGPEKQIERVLVLRNDLLDHFQNFLDVLRVQLCKVLCL